MALAEGTKVKHLAKSGANLSLPESFDAGALYYIQKSDENYELYFAISETDAKKVTTFITEDVSNLAYVKGDSIEAAIKKVNQSIKNAKVIINQKGEKKGEFTLNQNGDVTINLSDSDTTYNPATTSSDGLMSAVDKAKLDNLLVDGTINTNLLPSFVDDVLEYNTKSSFPSTGEAGKIYVDKSTNKTYRWGGSQYVEISESLAIGTTQGTAYDGAAGAALKERVDEITEGTKEVPEATVAQKLFVANLSNGGAIKAIVKDDSDDIEIYASDDDGTTYDVWVQRADKATEASSLTTKPQLSVGTTDSKKIKVTAGGKTSDEFTVPYATTAETANKTAKTLTVGSKTFNGSTDVTITKTDLGLNKVENKAPSEYFTAMSSDTTNAVSVTVGGVTKDITAATMKTSLGLGELAYKDSLAKGDVGLGNVDDTADDDKHVKSAKILRVVEAASDGLYYDESVYVDAKAVEESNNVLLRTKNNNTAGKVLVEGVASSDGESSFTYEEINAMDAALTWGTW